MANSWGTNGNWQIFLGSKITVNCDGRQEIQRCLLFGRKVMTNLDSVLKRRDITLQTKVCIVSYGFSSCHVWISELDHKDWGPKNWCSWTVILEKTLETPWTPRKQTSQSKRKSTLNIHWKDWCWTWSSNILVTWCIKPAHWKRL